jgi:fused signal recognition particle receptor
MFGSNDDKKTPAPAGEKKGLFGWLRKKPQEATPEPPQNAPAPAPQAEPEQEVPAVAEQHDAPVIPVERAPQPAPQPASQPSPVPAPSEAPAATEAPWLQLPVAEEPVAFTDEREHTPNLTWNPVLVR